MKIFAQFLLFFLLAAILLAYVAGEAADKQTGRLYARAHLSEVQNEGRKDMMTGLMPYAIIGVSAIGGSIAIIAMTYGLIVVATIWINRPQITRPTHTIEKNRIIETKTILILQPGEHSRREIFKLLGE